MENSNKLLEAKLMAIPVYPGDTRYMDYIIKRLETIPYSLELKNLVDNHDIDTPKKVYVKSNNYGVKIRT